MAVITTWSVQDMTHNDSDGGVFQVIWQCLAQNEGSTESAVSSGKFVTTYDASAAGYVPYADLTEATILSWVHTSLIIDDETAAEAKARIEADRTGKVDAQIVKNATTATGLPWMESE